MSQKIFYVIIYLIILLIGYEPNIAKLIKNALDIETESNSKYLEVFRGIRSQITNLLEGNYLFQFQV